MRPFEAEVRTDSITGTASGVRWTTQASSFSRRNRSRTSPAMTRVSIPNCLKQSISKERAGSLISTRATRAEAFFVRGGGARTIPDPDVFCMALGNAPRHYSGLPSGPWQTDRRTIRGYQGSITRNGRIVPGQGVQDYILYNLRWVTPASYGKELNWNPSVEKASSRAEFYWQFSNVVSLRGLHPRSEGLWLNGSNFAEGPLVMRSPTDASQVQSDAKNSVRAVWCPW